ncbi:MAG: GntG family PLP-dependent aldolase [Trueperaceae bacterium]|nr:GntG family PLP-dependent aldolase [Trueperaceae bacterium]
MRVIDLRSDTLTVPDRAMRRAMAKAEVGDDVYGEDPTVNQLQDELAERAGMEAGLFFPTGSMSNQAALAAHTRRGAEVIAPEGAHVYEYELGAMSALSGLTPRLLPAPYGVPNVDDLRAAVHTGGHQAPSGLVVLENTHNRAGGTVLPLDRQAELIAAAREAGLPVHLDGARAFNAAAALGAGIDEVCRGVDTASLCLSKGLGAPVGTVLVGRREVIMEAHRYRKMFGGGMRQAGVLAAAGLHALRHNVSRLADDHARAQTLAEGLAGLPGVDVDLEAVQTNMVYLRVAGARPLVAELAEHGVRAGATGPNTIRMVTHLHVRDEDVRRALRIVTERVAQRRAA